jgi:hypothetical protein
VAGYSGFLRFAGRLWGVWRRAAAAALAASKGPMRRSLVRRDRVRALPIVAKMVLL